jgi:hypothetical protein
LIKKKTLRKSIGRESFLKMTSPPVENVYHYPPEDKRDDTACSQCVQQRVARYRTKHRSWSEAQREKYARFKCTLRPGQDPSRAPCRHQPQAKVEPQWMHWAFVVIVAVLLFWLLL